MYIFWSWVFERVVRNQNQRHVSRKCVLKNLWADWYWYALSSNYLITMHEIDTAADVSWEWWLKENNWLKKACSTLNSQ